MASTYSVQNIAGMQALTGLANNALIDVGGYTAIGDGGGGQFYWDSASTTTADGGLVFQATGGGTGRFKRIYSGRLNVRWWGAKGDDSTDDATAVQKAFDALNQRGGEIFFPYGTYAVSSFPTIDPTTGSDSTHERANIRITGEGGWWADRGSRVRYTGSGTFITIKSGVHLDVSFIELMTSQTGLTRLIRINTYGAIPAYSSFNVSFTHCRIGSTYDMSSELIQLANCSNVEFNHCCFSGPTNVLTLGTQQSLPENSGTFGGGAASQITLRNCLIQGDVQHCRCDTVVYEQCTFDANNVTNAPVRIKPSGDQRALNISLRDCWADFGSGAAANSAFYKQGGNDLGLVVQGGRIGADYPRGVELSSGKALVQAVTFKSTAANAAGIYINAGAIEVQNLANTFSMTGANANLVSDQRDSEQYFDLARLRQKKFTLANNAAGSMPLPVGKKGFGWISVTGVGGAAHFAWDTIGTFQLSPFNELETTWILDFTTGALTGSTGVSGHITLSIGTGADNTLYVENRGGASLSDITVLLFHVD